MQYARLGEWYRTVRGWIEMGIKGGNGDVSREIKLVLTLCVFINTCHKFTYPFINMLYICIQHKYKFLNSWGLLTCMSAYWLVQPFFFSKRNDTFSKMRHCPNFFFVVIMYLRYILHVPIETQVFFVCFVFFLLSLYQVPVDWKWDIRYFTLFSFFNFVFVVTNFRYSFNHSVYSPDSQWCCRAVSFMAVVPWEGRGWKESPEETQRGY